MVEKPPKKLETILRKEVYPQGVELSGGEKQKIGIARASMGYHDILILDEPASALDPIAEVRAVSADSQQSRRKYGNPHQSPDWFCSLSRSYFGVRQGSHCRRWNS